MDPEEDPFLPFSFLTFFDKISEGGVAGCRGKTMPDPIPPLWQRDKSIFKVKKTKLNKTIKRVYVR